MPKHCLLKHSSAVRNTNRTRLAECVQCIERTDVPVHSAPGGAYATAPECPYQIRYADMTGSRQKFIPALARKSQRLTERARLCSRRAVRRSLDERAFARFSSRARAKREATDQVMMAACVNMPWLCSQLPPRTHFDDGVAICHANHVALLLMPAGRSTAIHADAALLICACKQVVRCFNPRARVGRDSVNIHHWIS